MSILCAFMCRIMSSVPSFIEKFLDDFDGTKKGFTVEIYFHIFFAHHLNNFNSTEQLNLLSNKSLNDVKIFQWQINPSFS